MDEISDLTSMTVEIECRSIVADLGDSRSRDGFMIDGRSRRDFTSDDESISRHETLTGYSGHRVLSEIGIEYGIGDLVTHLIGMSCRDGFGGDDVGHRIREKRVKKKKKAKIHSIKKLS